MRILILGINYAPERTGIAPYTTALAQHLSAQHDVTVLTGMPHYPDWRVAPEHDVWRHEEDHGGSLKVIRLSHYVPRTPTIAARAVYESSWAARAAAAAHGMQPDLVLAVVPALLSARAARTIARRAGVPFGLIVQDVMSAAASQSGVKGGRFVSRSVERLERSIMAGADRIATIHPALAEDIARMSGKDTSVIYNWTHIEPAAPGAPSLRHRFGCRDTDIVALHSGNMGVKQNLEIVIDAARVSEAEGRGIHYVLAGGGSQYAHLQDYARDCENVSFVESVDDAEYAALLGSADVLLVNERPTVQRMSLPSKLTSYLVAGRPVVAATAEESATAEFLRDAGAGLLTPAGDAARLSDAIAKLAADPQLAARLVENGQEFARTRLSAASAMAAYDAWIDGLLAFRPSVGRHRSDAMEFVNALT